MIKLRRILMFCIVLSLGMEIMAIAQNSTSTGQGGAGGTVSGRADTATAGRSRDGFGTQPDPRVQNRTYLFADTNEILPYAVFVSSKVTSENKAPLIIALRGAGGNPTVFLRDVVLNLAEDEGYILVGAMGYNSMGSFGMPARGFGGRAGRGSPDAASQRRTETSRTAQSGRRASMTRGTGGTAEIDPVKISEYSEKDVMNVLEIVRKEFNIDDQRIYLMGHSQGGAGAIHLGGKYSSIWAAVAGLAPGAAGFQFDPNSNIRNLPVLIMVGENDILIASVRNLDAQMKAANVAHEYKELPGLDHGGIVMGGMPDVFKFFSRHTKTETK